VRRDVVPKEQVSSIENKRLGTKSTNKVKITHKTTVFQNHNGAHVEGSLVAGDVVAIDWDRTNEALRYGVKFVYVDCRAKGLEGYVPKSALNDSIYANCNGGVTGVTYGGDKWLEDGKRNILVLPYGDKGQSRCTYCGKKANAHKLQETKELADLCRDLIKFVARSDYEKISILEKLPASHPYQPRKGQGSTKGAMIGVAATNSKGRWHVFGHSGLINEDMFRDAVIAFAHKRGINALVAPEIQANAKLMGYDGKPLDEEHINRIGNEVYKEDGGFNPSKLKCAAPRILQLCNQTLDCKAIAMTEKWLGSSNNFDEEDSAKSCDKCRQMIPFFLCNKP
jgi:hypothetical protein